VDGGRSNAAVTKSSLNPAGEGLAKKGVRPGGFQRIDSRYPSLGEDCFGEEKGLSLAKERYARGGGG